MIEETLRRCAICKSLKPESEFNFKNKDAGLRHSYCRICHSAWQKAHYRREWYSNGRGRWGQPDPPLHY